MSCIKGGICEHGGCQNCNSSSYPVIRQRDEPKLKSLYGASEEELRKELKKRKQREKDLAKNRPIEAEIRKLEAKIRVLKRKLK